MENWPCYVFFGFLLSVVISDMSYLIDYINRNPVHLTQIENVLLKRCRTKDEKTPSFLRLGGFLWADFQNRMVVDRDETKELLERLSSGNSVLLMGHQASGKSVIMRTLGYQLALRRFVVFFANAESLNVDLALKDVKNWDMSNVVVLVDDVHRNPIACSDFLEKVRTLNAKIVLSSRPLNLNVFREGQGSQLVRLFENKVEANVTEKVISDMIEEYCKSLDVRYDPQTKDVTQIIRKCGTDLWLVTYLLSSWNPRKASIEKIAKADLYERVNQTRVSRWSTIDRNSIEVMQIVCALFQYEIPCAESYLIEAGLNNVAFRLVSEGHLIKRTRYYRLNHPSVARIYLETLEFCQLIGDLEKISVEILSSYLEKSEEERAHVFYKLSTFPKTIKKEMAVLKRMLKTMEFRELAHQIEQERDIGKIGFFSHSIYNLDQDSANKLLKMVGEESLMKKLIREPVVRKQRNLITEISKLDKGFAKLLSDKRLTVSAVIPLFNEEEVVSQISKNLSDYVDLAIVVDDGSIDETGKKAMQWGGIVVQHNSSKGLLPSIITGLEKAIHEDADLVILNIFPWINPHFIPKLISPILRQDADLVVGMSRGNQSDVQALNRKGVEKFLKYLPTEHSKLDLSLSLTSVLFSKILKVKEIDIGFLLIPHLRMAYHVSDMRRGRIPAYYRARYSRTYGNFPPKGN
jgi:hypothetical protein